MPDTLYTELYLTFLQSYDKAFLCLFYRWWARFSGGKKVFKSTQSIQVQKYL